VENFHLFFRFISNKIIAFLPNFFFFLCGLAKNFFIISLLADIWEFRDKGQGGEGHAN